LTTPTEGTMQSLPIASEAAERFGKELLSLVYKYNHEQVLTLYKQIATNTLFPDNEQNRIASLLGAILRYDKYATLKHTNDEIRNTMFPNEHRLLATQPFVQPLIINRHAIIQPQPVLWWDAQWQIDVTTANNKLGLFVLLRSDTTQAEKEVKITVKVGSIVARTLKKTFITNDQFGWHDLFASIPNYSNIPLSSLFSDTTISQNNQIKITCQMDAVQPEKTELDSTLMKAVCEEYEKISEIVRLKNVEELSQQHNEIVHTKSELEQLTKRYEQEAVSKQHLEAINITQERELQNLQNENQELRNRAENLQQELFMLQQSIEENPVDNELREKLNYMELEWNKVLSGSYGYRLVPTAEADQAFAPQSQSSQVLTPKPLSQPNVPKRKIESISPQTGTPLKRQKYSQELI
jgi:hypothetical protein